MKTLRALTPARSNPVRAEKRRGSIANSPTMAEKSERVGGGGGRRPVPLPATLSRPPLQKRGYIPIIILVISGIIITRDLTRFSVLHTATGRRSSRFRGICVRIEPKHGVAIV